ncbi:hypothetical protein GW17_00003716 [Ensete ventricosum]|nr:hypothetical protein GW17_00003716 [Ensete ventricosum]
MQTSQIWLSGLFMEGISSSTKREKLAGSSRVCYISLACYLNLKLRFIILRRTLHETSSRGYNRLAKLFSGKTHIARYIPVRQLTGTWTGRYRAVPLRSAVGGRFPPSMVGFRRLRSI